MGSGEPEAQGVFWQEAFVRDPAYPVGAERYGSVLQFSSTTEGLLTSDFTPTSP